MAQELALAAPLFGREIKMKLLRQGRVRATLTTRLLRPFSALRTFFIRLFISCCRRLFLALSRIKTDVSQGGYRPTPGDPWNLSAPPPELPELQPGKVLVKRPFCCGLLPVRCCQGADLFFCRYLRTIL